jgi:hypothetical protein
MVRGVTGHEMCHYFFSPDVRMDWESKWYQPLKVYLIWRVLSFEVWCWVVW